MVTDVRKGIRNCEFLASKQFESFCDFFVDDCVLHFYRGGVAVVWLGKKDGQTYAMKQFPKNGTGQMKFDPSAYVEL